MSSSDCEDILKKLLLQNKGGETTAKIIEKLLVRPYNPNQIAKSLEMSYNTVYYHMQTMLSYDLIEKKGDAYGSLYEATQKLLNEVDVFNELKKLI